MISEALMKRSSYPVLINDSIFYGNDYCQQETVAGTAYDYYAHLNIIPALEQVGLSVMADLSLADFFNTPWSEKSVWRLISMSINETRMARLAIEMLFSETTETDVIIEPEIVERKLVINF